MRCEPPSPQPPPSRGGGASLARRPRSFIQGRSAAAGRWPTRNDVGWCDNSGQDGNASGTRRSSCRFAVWKTRAIASCAACWIRRRCSSPAETFGVDLVDVLRAGRPCGKPAVFGDHLDAADRGAVAGSVGQRRAYRLAGEFCQAELIRRQRLQQRPSVRRSRARRSARRTARPVRASGVGKFRPGPARFAR